MYDFHMHSRVSFDGHETGLAMAREAVKAGLKEICFTDHLDYDPLGYISNMAFDTAAYNAEYDGLDVPGIRIRRGMEFGMTPENVALFAEDLKRREFDFVLGSVHFAENLDVYFAPYWQGKTVHEAEARYLQETLRCVENHDSFDVLAHLNFISKATAHPAPRPLPYAEHRDIVDEILKVLIRKGKGMEINTSGVDRRAGYLPTADILKRFHDLGGEIVTVGSDAHRLNRVGQYTFEACGILKDIFGYVCTFENRQPIFHKL